MEGRSSEQCIMRRTQPGYRSAYLAGAPFGIVHPSLSSNSWYPCLHFSFSFMCVLCFFSHIGYRFKSKVRSLDHFEELQMCDLALPFVLLDCFLPFPAWSKFKAPCSREE